jgi:predicted transporter
MIAFRNLHLFFLVLCIAFTLGVAAWNAAVFVQVRAGLYPFVAMGALMMLAGLVYRLVRVWQWKEHDA